MLDWAGMTNQGPPPEFDGLSSAYEEMLKDPIRERFTGGGCEFFHARKAELIRKYFQRRRLDTQKMSYLDFGCGKGDLLKLLGADFGSAAGCDPSAGMLAAGQLGDSGITARVQDDPSRIPFDPGQFDLVTAVCVYHHVPPAERDSLTAEVRRVLKPGGVFAIIEHNPNNPVVRLIVSRTPVDANAILLPASEAESRLRVRGFRVDSKEFFLYLPRHLYGMCAFVESGLKALPLGGQYAVFGLAPATD